MFVVPKTMRAVVYRGVNDLRLETVPVPRLRAHELLVKVAVCGVCPTDIKKIQHGTVPPPRIFGHETAGTVVQIGGGKAGLEIPLTRPEATLSPVGGEGRVRGRSGFVVSVGDRVALHHHVPCLQCHYCRHRAFAQCATYKRTGITAGFEPAGGGYAQYVRVMPFVLPGVVKIPRRNSFEEGAMLEPVNTVLKAVKRLNLLRGDAVLVAGQGPIGLMFTRLLQLAGARVLATDLLDARLKLAKQFGAKWTRLAGTPRRAVRARVQRAQYLSQRVPVRRWTRRSDIPAGCPYPFSSLDAAVIAVPSDAAVHEALRLVRGGGQVLLFAHTRRFGQSGRAELPLRRDARQRVPTALVTQPSTLNSQLDFSSICLDEKDLIGSYSSDFTLQAEVARLVFSRRLDVRRLITHRFPLEQTAAAVRLAANPQPDSLKVLVQIAPE